MTTSAPEPNKLYGYEGLPTEIQFEMQKQKAMIAKLSRADLEDLYLRLLVHHYVKSETTKKLLKL